LPQADIFAVVAVRNDLPANTRALVDFLLEEFASRRSGEDEAYGGW